MIETSTVSLEAGRLDLLDEGVVDGHRAGEDAGRAGADASPAAAVAGLLDLDVAGVALVCRVLVAHGLGHPFTRRPSPSGRE